MFGKTLARKLCQLCLAAGYKPQQQHLDNKISIAGVGNGANSIEYNYDGPIAVTTKDGPAKLFNLKAGIVEEPGENLPGLLGLDVLKSRRAIMDIGNKQLIFPGAGPVEVSYPPGSTIIPLEEAPSGHLCMIIDAYNQVEKKNGGVEIPVQQLKLPRSQNLQ